MQLTKKVITEHIKRFSDFQYYIDVPIIKIESNLEDFPDVAIEACKALIEGVSKSILIRLDPTFDEKKATTGRNPRSVQQLFKLALEKVNEMSSGFETGYVHSSGHIINMTQSMRTARGDISHGKSVPKLINSSPAFAKLTASMTDLTVSYVLEHFFVINADYRDRLRYEAEDSKEFNLWLDDTVEDFPISTVSYSYLLHEHDYEAYEYLYQNDYQTHLESEKEDESADADALLVDGTSTPPISVEEGVRETKEETGKARAEPIVPEGDIVPWTADDEAELVALATALNLKLPFARRVVQQYIFDRLTPLADSIVETLTERPRLMERRRKVEGTTERLLALAEIIAPTPSVPAPVTGRGAAASAP
jgi:hypothetical protein